MYESSTKSELFPYFSSACKKPPSPLLDLQLANDRTSDDESCTLQNNTAEERAQRFSDTKGSILISSSVRDLYV